MSTFDILQEAINNAEVLKIKYYGGSQPGTVREISPISIFKDKVRARCLSSNTVKKFFIDKIEILDRDDQDNETRWNPAKKYETKYENLAVFCELKRSELENLGWYVTINDNYISLHRRFKNGKPLKGFSVLLYYEEYTSDIYVDLDGELKEENIRKRKMPWVVRAKDMGTKVYGKLDKAADVFIEQAIILSPNINKK